MFIGSPILKVNRTYLKKRILVQNQGGREVQPGGILLYFEDLNRAPNAEFGPKDFFEMGSTEMLAGWPAVSHDRPVFLFN
jgi:hypothetical protein